MCNRANAEYNATQARDFHEENGDLAALAAEAPDLHEEVRQKLADFEAAQVAREGEE